jgi:hypothetical protein
MEHNNLALPNVEERKRMKILNDPAFVPEILAIVSLGIFVGVFLVVSFLG